jgi:hypothetical protein
LIGGSWDLWLQQSRSGSVSANVALPFTTTRLAVQHQIIGKIEDRQRSWCRWRLSSESTWLASFSSSFSSSNKPSSGWPIQMDTSSSSSQQV